MTKKIVLLIASVLLAPFILVANPGLAGAADTANCKGTKDDPIFGHDSSQELFRLERTDPNGNFLDIPIRLGFYCVPEIYEGKSEEFTEGFGFGLQKMQHRHHITREPGWPREYALIAAKAALSSPVITRSDDDWGIGYAMSTWVSHGQGCTYDPEQLCQDYDWLRVVAAATRGGAENEDRGGMPAGAPLGLQTVYCDYNDNGVEEVVDRLRCKSWVSEALVDLGEEMGF